MILPAKEAKKNVLANLRLFLSGTFVVLAVKLFKAFSPNVKNETFYVGLKTENRG
jgi:hypothetical protein